MLFAGSVIGAVTVGSAWVLDPGRRSAIARICGWLLVAYAGMAVVAVTYLASALGDGGPAAVGAARQRGADLLSFVLPTPLAELGGGATARVAPAALTTGYVETGVYLGAPLLAMLAQFWAGSWRRPVARVLLVAFATASVLALGARLRIDGHTIVPLPWALVSGLPLFDAMLPIRLGVFAALAAAIAVALWLAGSARTAGWSRWLLAGLAIVALAPAIGNGYWSSRPRVPAFFSGRAWRAEIRANDVALVLPDDDRAAAMLWQASTHIGFSMAGGYLGENGRDPQAREPLHATLLRNGPSTPEVAPQLQDYVTRHRVTVIVVDPTRPGPWLAALDALGLRPQVVAGVIFYRIVPRSPRAAASSGLSLLHRS
jgi:hypothetical protein